jgi:acetyl esterase/lipase
LGANWFDIDYVGDGLTGHLLDIYQPSTASPPYPVVVFIYGSAWRCNDCKGAVTHVLPALLDGGFAVVSINHRASQEAVFPAQIQDCKAAIRYVRANAAVYDLDPDRIGVTGRSSGGHLVAHLGTSGGVTTYTVGGVEMDIEGSLGEHTDASSSVQAVCDWFGPTDFLIMNSCGSDIDHDAPDSPESQLIGGPIQEHPNECALADPITYVDSSDPPFRIFHGDSDPLVPHCQSDSLDQALDAVGVPSDYTLIPGAGHGWPDENEQADMVAFFQTYLDDIVVVPGDGNLAGSGSPEPTLLSTRPNPFSQFTVVRLHLAGPSMVNVVIHDASGRLVRTLFSGPRNGGSHSLMWNGCDDSGHRVASGFYFSRLEAGSHRVSRRLMLLK